MDPTLVVLAYSAAAAGAAAFGALPLWRRGSIPTRWIGWANASAAGLMLGAAYALATAGLGQHALQSGLGAVVGIAFVFLTRSVSGTADLDLNRLDDTSPDYGYKVVLINALHSAAEGVAIGVAMAVNLPFGVSVAVAIAVHNVPEATVLCWVLRARGVRLVDGAGVAVVTNVSQVLLSVVTFSVVAAAPSTVPWVLGFSVGTLVYLVMVEALPESYRQAGPTSIALVTSLTMGVLVLLVAVS